MKRVSALGLALDKKVKIETLEKISPTLKFVIHNHGAVMSAFAALPKEMQTSFQETSACDDMQNLKSNENNTQGLMLLTDGQKPLWAEGFCPNMGALVRYQKYEFLGTLGNSKEFVLVLKSIDMPGAHALEHIEESIVISKPIHR